MSKRRNYADNPKGKVRFGKHGDDPAVNAWLHQAAAAGEMTSDERREHIRRFQKEGDIEARDRLVACNMLLCVRFAPKFLDRGVPLVDLLQVGTLGIMVAAERFDLERKDGGKPIAFSTYASAWIMQYMSRECTTRGRTIRIPEHQWQGGLSPELLRLEGPSLDSKIASQGSGDSLDATLGSLLADENAPDQVGDADREQRASLLRAVLAEMDPKMRRIVEAKCYDEMTLAETGLELGVSRERIRQILEQAKRKIAKAFRAAGWYEDAATKVIRLVDAKDHKRTQNGKAYMRRRKQERVERREQAKRAERRKRAGDGGVEMHVEKARKAVGSP